MTNKTIKKQSRVIAFLLTVMLLITGMTVSEIFKPVIVLATSTVTFCPKAPVIGAASTGRNTIIINFQSQNVVGYRLWIADNNNFTNKKIYDSSNSKFTLIGLKANTKYCIKAATYIIQNGQKVYSNSNNFTLTTRLAPTPTVSSLKSTYFTVSTTLQKANVTGYRIYIADNKDFKNSIQLQNITGVFSQKLLKQNTTYYVKAYTYIVKNGKVYWSNASVKTIKTIAVPMATVKSISSTTDSISLTFNKKNVDGYCIWVSENKDYSNHKTYSSKSNTFNIKNLKSGTTYYIKSAGYVIRGGKNYYSDSNNFSVSTEAFTIYADGDSIAYGAGSGGYSYVDILRDEYRFDVTKAAVNGSTLAQNDDEIKDLTKRVLNNFNSEYDYALIEGGVNDYCQNLPLGEVTEPLTDEFDTTTVCGGLEMIFYHIKKTSPGTQLYFLVNHKINDIDTTANELGLTYLDYYNAILMICDKYGVTVINCHEDCALDTSDETMREVYTFKSVSKPNGDGVHPNLEGYKKFYMPTVLNAMKIIA